MNQNNRSQPMESKSDTDADLAFHQMADIADQIASDFQCGKTVDVEHFVLQFPELKEQIRDTYASLQQVFGVRREIEEQLVESNARMPEHSMIGEYRIVRELGRGGMGIVYEAEQGSLQRRVALKVLPFAALLDSKRLERFRNEARAAAQLKHPNIVSIYSVGYENSVHFFSMELIEGKSLTEIIADIHSQVREAGRGDADPASRSPNAETQPMAQLTTALSADRRSFYRSVARLGIQAAEALHFAHQEGIIHRDVKPANLLLDRDGTLHVADFGLARLESGADLTVTGDIVGTLRYMSPEQLENDGLVDQRTDVYSFGVSLIEMVTRQASVLAQRKQENDGLPATKSTLLWRDGAHRHA